MTPDGFFTASNNWKVSLDQRGATLYDELGRERGGPGPTQLLPLTEFILHQHGLWLAPNGLVCIRQPEENLVGVIFNDGDVAYMTRGVRKATWVTHAAESAADAYFGAHPAKPKQCDAVLEVEGVLLRCDQEGAHTVHEASGKTSQGQGFAVTWETPR